MTIRVPKFLLILLGVVLLVGGGVAIGVAVTGDSSSDEAQSDDVTSSDTEVPETDASEAQEAFRLSQEMDAAMEQDDAASDEEFEVCERLNAGQSCFNRAVTTTAEAAVRLDFLALAKDVGPECAHAIRKFTTPGLFNDPRKAADACLAEAQ